MLLALSAAAIGLASVSDGASADPEKLPLILRISSFLGHPRPKRSETSTYDAWLMWSVDEKRLLRALQLMDSASGSVKSDEPGLFGARFITSDELDNKYGEHGELWTFEASLEEAHSLHFLSLLGELEFVDTADPVDGTWEFHYSPDEMVWLFVNPERTGYSRAEVSREQVSDALAKLFPEG